jgi:hypothetical protein
MSLASAGGPHRVRAFPFAGCPKRRRGWYTGGVKQFGRRAGRGGDVLPILSGHAKANRSGRVFSAPSLFFFLDSGAERHPVSDFGIVHLHRGVKAAYL